MSYRIAGIDVHKKMLAVVIADVEGNGEYQFERRKFLTTTEALRELAEWLNQQTVEEVVMESTAQYWRPVWGMLEQCWQPVREQRPGSVRRLHLAQAKSNAGRRGRKNDFPDAERLVKRLVARELILSFVPCPAQRLWRTVARRRNQLMEQKVQLQNQLESLLQEAHVKLSSVVSDLFGVSSRRMLTALSKGERDLNALTGMADASLRATPAQLRDALSACRDWDSTYPELLRMVLEELKLLEKQMGELEKHAACLMAAHEESIQRLVEVPGLRSISALQIVAEVGPGAETFPTADRLSSWVGVIPGEQVSAGENASTQSPKGNCNMRRILDQAAHAAIKTRGSIFEVKFQHFIKHMEYKEAVWAVAHFLCKIVWKILHDGVRYEERGPAVSAAVKRKRASRLIRELKALGYHIAPPQKQLQHSS